MSDTNQSSVYIGTRDFVIVWSNALNASLLIRIVVRDGINTARHRFSISIPAFHTPPQPHPSLIKHVWKS